MPPKIINPYFRASKDVLQKAREKCVNGLNAKTVYDEINKESGGVYYSSSQSSELRDMRQVHRQKEKAKVTKGMSALGFSGELSTAIMLQRSDPEFIKTISCIRDSYYIFLGTTIQLDDIQSTLVISNTCYLELSVSRTFWPVP